MKKAVKITVLSEEENFRNETEKKTSAHFRLSVGQNQKDFIDNLLKKTGLRIGQLVWQSILYANSHNIDIPFLNEHINFICDKKHGLEIGIQKVMTSHDNLKEAAKNYKSLNYKIGIKGVVLLYLLYYAKYHLKMDIKKYKNFNN